LPIKYHTSIGTGEMIIDLWVSGIPPVLFIYFVVNNYLAVKSVIIYWWDYPSWEFTDPTSKLFN
jgi:hypothetical protein